MVFRVLVPEKRCFPAASVYLFVVVDFFRPIFLRLSLRYSQVTKGLLEINLIGFAVSAPNIANHVILR